MYGINPQSLSPVVCRLVAGQDHHDKEGKTEQGCSQHEGQEAEGKDKPVLVAIPASSAFAISRSLTTGQCCLYSGLAVLSQLLSPHSNLL